MEGLSRLEVLRSCSCKVYGTLLHRLWYLPYSSGAPFTVVCPTGKYCNVLREIHPSVVCNVPSTGAMVYPPLQCSVCCCNVSAAPSTALHCNTMHPLPLQRNMAFFHCNTFSSFMQHNSVPHCNTCLPPLQCNWVSHCNTLVPLQHSASTGKYCCTLCAIYPSAIAMFSLHCNTSLIAMQVGLPCCDTGINDKP